MKLRLKDGGQLAYERTGRGSPLLLLRPLGGSMVSWDRFATILAERHEVIAFDPRGAGLSSRPPALWSTRRMAADAAALLDHLAVARCHVYGISMGGMAASWLAIDRPERVGRLVLASTLPRGLDIRALALGRGVSLSLCLTKPSRDADACLATRMLSHRFREANPADVERIRALARLHPSPRLAIFALLGAIAGHDARAALHRIAAPTLVLRGMRDPLLTEAGQFRLLHRIPNAVHEELDDVGHDLSAEAPERTAARVLDFLRDGSADTPPSD